MRTRTSEGNSNSGDNEWSREEQPRTRLCECVSVCTCVAAAVADAGGDAAGEAEEPLPGSVLPAQPLTFTNSEPR